MWKKLSSKVLFQHPRLTVEEDKVQIESGKVIEYLRYGYDGEGVVIVARNDNNEVLFVREYSYIPNKRILQLPMGKIEEGETYEAAANRELQEEANFKASELTVKGSYFQNHRRSANKGYVVLVTDLEASSVQADAEEESIESVWIPIDAIQKYIDQGEIVDADTLSSLAICGFWSAKS
jgi:8-oxo-dGTP pyrophosphatase MutT (NUDIX family)